MPKTEAALPWPAAGIGMRWTDGHVSEQTENVRPRAAEVSIITWSIRVLTYIHLQYSLTIIYNANSAKPRKKKKNE